MLLVSGVYYYNLYYVIQDEKELLFVRQPLYKQMISYKAPSKISLI